MLHLSLNRNELYSTLHCFKEIFIKKLLHFKLLKI